MERPTCLIWRHAAVATIACLSLGAQALAASTTLSGHLNDPGHAALAGPDLGPARFGDDFEIANNVALHPIVVPFAGTVRFDSNGFAAGGADPYFTLFAGTGDLASFLGSNYAEAFSVGGDFDLSFNLPAGSFTVAVGAFANMSFAENLGGGSLGDGFVALGTPGSLGNTYYEIVVTTPDRPGPSVPEPAPLALMLAGTVGIALARRRGAQGPESGHAIGHQPGRHAIP